MTEGVDGFVLREARQTVLVIACGALARELDQICRSNSLSNITVQCLPAKLHSTPSRIPGAIKERVERDGHRFDNVFIAYADCGTRGELDRLLDELGLERLAGAHCYQFLAGESAFEAMHAFEPATFYLTDFLARNFDRLVWRSLGLDKYPGLKDDYFAHYRRVLYMSQEEDPALVERAQSAARQLGLEFEHRHVGFGDLESSMVSLSAAPSKQPSA